MARAGTPPLTSHLSHTPCHTEAVAVCPLWRTAVLRAVPIMSGDALCHVCLAIKHSGFPVHVSRHGCDWKTRADESDHTSL